MTCVITNVFISTCVQIDLTPRGVQLVVQLKAVRRPLSKRRSHAKVAKSLALLPPEASGALQNA